MRVIVLTAALLAACCGWSQAADHSGNYSLFYGFSYANAQLAGERSSYYGLGANLGVYLGDLNTVLVGDLSLQFRDGSYLLYALGGVRQVFPSEAASFFVEGLAGISSLNPKVGETQTSPAFGGGGGIDWNLGERFAIRAPQADVLWGSHDGNTFHDFRIQAGVAFYF